MSLSNKFNFQSVQTPVTRRVFSPGGSSPRDGAMGSGVRLLQKAIVNLNAVGMAYRASQELTALEPKIEQAIEARESGAQLVTDPKLSQCHLTYGVLIEVKCMEWEIPDPTGQRAQRFCNVEIINTGLDAVRTTKNYLVIPRARVSAPKGWRFKFFYLWATRKA